MHAQGAVARVILLMILLEASLTSVVWLLECQQHVLRHIIHIVPAVEQSIPEVMQSSSKALFWGNQQVGARK